MSGEAQSRSLWVDTAPESNFSKLEGKAEADVVVIGAGVAGLTTALLLKRAGIKTAVIDAGRVGRGVTGHTTGKVTALQGLVYQELRRKHGLEAARIYGEANAAAVETVAEIVESEGIDCDFKRTSNYTYTATDSAREAVSREARLCAELDLPSTFTSTTTLPFDVRGAVRFDDQAQIHAVKYVAGLAAAVDGGGCNIYEESQVVEVSDGKPCRIVTDDGELSSKSVVVATNLPILDRGLFFARCHPYRSYVIAVELDAPLPDGTFISADQPMRSLLPYSGGDRELLLVGGEGHRASESVEADERYRRLEDWTRENFSVRSVRYRWSTQDAVPVDGIPYIGRISPFSRNTYVATGFRKWGLSNGTVAAILLRDQLLGQANPWAGTFDSNRLALRAGARGFVGENLRVGMRLFRDRLRSRSAGAPELARGEGRVVDIDGRKAAVCMDEHGDSHAVEAACTHLGCLVEWNGSDLTWDCPCHGSRFRPDGEVIRGPATKPLAPVERG